ncbi:MAG: S8 family serine peptidase [Defluviicoccus sp.]|nr:S8 family serine peptidase [Defluviicoccus sp.]
MQPARPGPGRTGRRLAAGIAALAALALSGCNGGGGDGSSSGPLYNQWGLRTIKADRAYDRLEAIHGDGTAPGSGQTLGAIDTGIDEDHPMFDGKSVIEIPLGSATNETGNEVSHGTAVASVMAGNPSDAYAAELNAPRGVAWGADIAMFSVPLGRPGPFYNPIPLFGLRSVDNRRASMATAVTGRTGGGRTIDFLNMSFGYPGIIEQYSEHELRANYGAAIAALAQAGSPDKTVFVWAAGNAHGRDCDPADFAGDPDLCVDEKVVASSVDIDAGLPARIRELRGHVIAVVAVGRDGRIASFSNRCGIAADWCVAAPGVGVRAAYFGPDPDDGSPGAQGAFSPSGTSFAAPMVTGGLAVINHAFRRQLPNTDLVKRLLDTADDSGIYADRSIYGQGLLDLGAATAPVGTVTVALGGRVAGPGSSLAGTRFTAGGALGSGLAQALAGHEIAAFDSLGAPFWFHLGDLAGAAPARPMLARLRAFVAPGKDDPGPGVLRPRFAALTAGDRLSLGVLRAPNSGAGHLSLAGSALALGTAERDGLRVTAFSTEGMGWESPASGAALSWRPGGGKLGLTGGVVGERQTMLGSTAAGAFGRVSGASAFAGIEGRAAIGAWSIGAGAELGTVRAATGGGMIAGVSPLTTSAFAVAAGRTLANGDGIEVSLSQPLRVEAGRVRLSVPIGRSIDGLVQRRSLSAGLAPGGRQIDIAASWHRTLAGGGTASVGAVWTRQPGHDAAADPELSLLAGWRYAF